MASTYSASSAKRPDWQIIGNYHSSKAILAGPVETRIPLMPMFGPEQRDDTPLAIFEDGLDDLEVLQRVIEDDNFSVEAHVKSIRKRIAIGQVITSEAVLNGLRMQAREDETDDDFGLGPESMHSGEHFIDGVPVLQLEEVSAPLKVDAPVAAASLTSRLTLKRKSKEDEVEAAKAAENEAAKAAEKKPEAVEKASAEKPNNEIGNEDGDDDEDGAEEPLLDIRNMAM